MDPTVFFGLSYGMYVISALDGDRPVGCIANCAVQITAEPATLAVSLNHDNYTNSCVAKTKKFAVSILSVDTDNSVIGNFGFSSSRDKDKFLDQSMLMRSGLPVLKESCGYIVCEVIDTLETETHTVFLGRVIDGEPLSAKEPMTYSYYHKVVKGKSPKNAPTYLPPKEEEKMSENKPIYECSVCGYVYDGDIPFEDLPEDYVCPLCGQPKGVFVKKD